MGLVDQLIECGAADEALGVWRPEKKIFGVPRPRVIDPAGRAWRLGALLIDRNGQLYATGNVTRAIVPKDFNSDKTMAGHERREIQRAAARGAFRPGESVNYDWRRVTADEARELVAPTDLEAYLRERFALLT
jgi:hypothetical protein